MNAKYRDTPEALRVHDFESVDDCAFIFRHLIPWTHFKYTFLDLVRPISVTHGRNYVFLCNALHGHVVCAA